MTRFYPKRGSVRQWLDDHASHEGDECLTWPYSKNPDGVGQLRINRKLFGAHVIMCEIVNGPKPPDKHEVAHSCGNGHMACVNPRHLRWATQSENSMDRVIHGTSNRGERHGMSKLTADVVLALRSASGSCREIADAFGVSASTVSAVKLGKRWGWLAD